MKYRVVVVELAADGDVSLLNLVEDSWIMAQSVMDGLRSVVAERGSRVLYGAILDVPETSGGHSEGCCREAGAKVLA